MMTVHELKSLIDDWRKGTWLSNNEFDCPDNILEAALEEFKDDYSRWYCGPILKEQLSITPQLIAVLLYRIAHKCNLLPPLIKEHCSQFMQ